MAHNQQPFFRFQPYAYTNGIFDTNQEKEPCSVCKQVSEFMYHGPFYSVQEVKGICPVCIHNGEASSVFQGVFQGGVEYAGGSLSVTYDDGLNKFVYYLNTEEVPEIQNPMIDELLFRTPGYVSWQEPYWLTEQHVPLAFVQYLNEDDIREYGSLLNQAMYEVRERYGIQDNLSFVSEDAGIYLFESISEKHSYRLHIDFT